MNCITTAFYASEQGAHSDRNSKVNEQMNVTAVR